MPPPSHSRISLLLLAIHVAIIPVLKPVSATSTASTSSYQPTSGVEERWVLEEEFHGASSSTTRHRKNKRKMQSFPGHDGLKNQSETSWWDEDDDEMNTSDVVDTSFPADEIKSAEKRRHRFRGWKNTKTVAVETAEQSSSGGESFPCHSYDYDEEHPMRTDEWELDVRLSRLFSKEEGDLFPEYQNEGEPQYRGDYRKRQVLNFARNGYVKVLGGDQSYNPQSPIRKNKAKVGKWRIGHSGVAFDIPIQVYDNHYKSKKESSVDTMQPKLMVLRYHADIHLNKFGERPRMFRGVITRDRHSSFLPPNFLRPVIGTFSAEGIGRDTADTSYKQRAYGLSRQQAVDEMKSSRQLR